MGQGEHAVIIEYRPQSDTCFISSISHAPVSPSQLSSLYLSQCTRAYEEVDPAVIMANEHLSEFAQSSSLSLPVSAPIASQSLPYVLSLSVSSTQSHFSSSNSSANMSGIHQTFLHTVAIADDTQRQTFVSAKKKYKPVHLKVNPVRASLPSEFRIDRKIAGDPLANMPVLPTHPQTFKPTGRYTQERRDAFRARHDTGFLWPKELDLVDQLMMSHEQGFAWGEDERGSFKPEYFPPVKIPVLPHTPWVEKNIPIPPGLYDEICNIIRKKIAAGVYEPSNSSYRSRWFCVLKKDGKSLRLVHSLEPLNRVTIQHVGVPPMPEHLAEQFGGRACISTLDLYVGYDERHLAEESRDLTTFQSPLGAMRLTTLPMGWSNSVPIFHDDVTYTLQDEIPDPAGAYVDDVSIKGPATPYLLEDGSHETIPHNRSIRRFVFEHLQNVNRIIQRLKYVGATCSGTKSTLIAREGMVLGHRCTPLGREPDPSRVDAIRNWGPCQSLTEVRAFLGTVGILRNFILGFAKIAHPLSRLTKKDVPFEWGTAQMDAQKALKAAVLNCPAIRAIDYKSSAPVILAVDTSNIAVGFFLAQCDAQRPNVRYYNRFCSITLNEREARFSQPKLELYGLYRALGSLKVYLVGLRSFIVEMDARYVRGMLQHPDLMPNATLNRWIVSILLFHFDLRHVPAHYHGPDGLSRRPLQDGDAEPLDPSIFEDWVDRLHGFCHMIQPTLFPYSLHPYSKIAPVDIFSQEITQQPAYSDCPRSNAARKADTRLIAIKEWLATLTRPTDLSDDQYKALLTAALGFFLHAGRLWKKDHQGEPKIVVDPDDRIRVLVECHDHLGHRGTYATKSQVATRFWWPHFAADVHWYVRTCHLCQKRRIQQVLLPPTVAPPAPLFTKIYVDTMHMPPSAGKHYIVQGRCHLSHWPEFRMLAKETAKALGDWIFEDILCRWGGLSEIVSDNGAPFVKALDYLQKRYHVVHIRISGYNSRANGVVERPHFDVRQALYKAANEDQSKWASVAASVFWSERITPRRRMGCSPYFAVTGCHPVIPLDVVEATYLVKPPTKILSTTDLIARRAIALQKRATDLQELHSKVYAARNEAARRFEVEHQHTIKDYNFKRGDLVLVRNTAIEKALNRKMRARYTGPVVVICRNKGGAYVVCELDGTVYDRPVAAFRLLPYRARSQIPLPDDVLDIPPERLRAMQDDNSKGEDDHHHLVHDFVDMMDLPDDDQRARTTAIDLDEDDEM